MSAALRKNAANTRGRPFAPGNAGRPKGSRNQATLVVEQMLDGEAETITRKVIDLALQGNGIALRLVFERLAPPRRERPVTVALPQIETMEDIVKASRAVLAAVAAGDLTPAEAAELGRLLDTHVKAVEALDLEQRLRALEERSR